MCVRRETLILVLLIAGCVRGGFGVEDAVSNADSSADDAGVDDVSPAALVFSAPVAVPGAELNSAGKERGPHLSVDGLRLYFYGDRQGTDDLFVATRPDLTSGFDRVVPIQELNTDEADESPTLTDDERTLVFVRKGHMMQANRTSRGVPFGTPRELASVSLSGSSEDDPGLSADGRWLVFASNQGGSFDIWTASRPAVDAAFEAPRPLEIVNSPQSDKCPAFGGADWLIFASSRPGGQGSRDIYLARRSGAAASFAPPVAVAAINSSAGDSDPYLHVTLRLVVFSKHSPTGGDDLYWATF